MNLEKLAVSGSINNIIMSKHRANKKITLIEGLWFVIALVSLFIAIYQTSNEGIQKSYRFFAFAIVAFGMFSLRRYMRRNSK